MSTSNPTCADDDSDWNIPGNIAVMTQVRYPISRDPYKRSFSTVKGKGRGITCYEYKNIKHKIQNKIKQIYLAYICKVTKYTAPV